MIYKNIKASKAPKEETKCLKLLHVFYKNKTHKNINYFKGVYLKLKKFKEHHKAFKPLISKNTKLSFTGYTNKFKET